MRKLVAVVLAATVVAVVAGAVLVPRRAGAVDDVVGEATLRLADGTRIGSVEFLAGRPIAAARLSITPPAGVPAPAAGAVVRVHANDDASNGEGCLADPTQPSATWFQAADAEVSSAVPGLVAVLHAGGDRVACGVIV
jgi:hypothetical protein